MSCHPPICANDMADKIALAQHYCILHARPKRRQLWLFLDAVNRSRKKRSQRVMWSGRQFFKYLIAQLVSSSHTLLFCHGQPTNAATCLQYIQNDRHPQQETIDQFKPIACPGFPRVFAFENKSEIPKAVGGDH